MKVPLPSLTTHIERRVTHLLLLNCQACTVCHSFLFYYRIISKESVVTTYTLFRVLELTSLYGIPPSLFSYLHLKMLPI